MTYMEIASYLGIVGTVLKTAGKETEIEQKVYQAVCEAQIIMYEHAKQEIVGMFLKEE